jgi:hypothetical protein
MVLAGVIGGVVVLVVLLVVVAVIAVVGKRSSGSGAGATSTELTLAQRTDKAASLLRASLCGYMTSDGCTVDSAPGAIEIHVSKFSVDETKLQDAGKQSGLWTNADVLRMEQTRALDGTQRTADGKVSWTFHPDSGLNAVVTIDSTWQPPVGAGNAT